MPELEQLDSGLYVSRKNGRLLVINPYGFRWAVIPESELDSLEGSERHPELSERLRRDGILGSNTRQDGICRNRNKDLSIVVLHTTNRCSLGCDYCYSDANASQEEMTLDTSRKVIDRIVESNPKKPVKIEFHGGEPTLKPELIINTVAYANQFRLGESPMFVYSIQTNGVNIPDPLMDLFRDARFSIGVSLDGPERFHDAHRVFSSGKGSFGEVIETIRLFNQFGLKYGTTCVVTDPDVLDFYPDFLVEHQIPAVKFNPYFDGQGRASSPEMSKETQITYADKMLGLADRLFALRGKRRHSVANLSLLLKNLVSPERSYMCLRFPCGAGISMLGIGINGEAYSCEEMNGNPELVMGNIHNNSLDEILSSERNLLIKNRALEDMTDCPDCFAVDVCAVNCANRSYTKSKAFNSKTSLCEYYKRVIPGLIWRIYENPEILKCLK